MEIKVLGPGCAKCQKTEEVVSEAVAESGVDANVEKVKTELTEIGIVPEEWGGDIMMVEVSPKQNTGIDSLLE